MFKRCASATLIGLQAAPIVAEAFRGRGIPGTHLVGLARGAVRESLTRVKSAITSSGFVLATEKVVVNLLPAEIPKSASALDLPLAMALLAINELIDEKALLGRRFYGELSLNGGVEPVRGVSLVADLSLREDDDELIVPSANADEACLIPSVRVIAVSSLAQLVAHLVGSAPLTPHVATAQPPPLWTQEPCLTDVFGQTTAKRALEIAAAGAHNVLMTGPPGSGKTMLARRLPSLMPPLEADERVEVMRIHSAAGQLGRGLIETRPFRSPHHTSSDVALCGGSSPPHPGEISLAHNGVLFLDEFPEFSRRSLEALREPLEDGVVHVSRAAFSVEFPARALLVAAMNPCPCGYYRDGGVTAAVATARVCLCGFDAVRRYRSRISGPLLDRIDLHVRVDSVPYRELVRRGDGETSAVVRRRVVAARQRQLARFGASRSNTEMTPGEVQTYVALDTSMMARIESAIEEGGLSTRAVTRALKVARTIADLEGVDCVRDEHVAEALALRVPDRDAQAVATALSA